MKRIPYEVHISEEMLGRVRKICAQTGITESAFVESAIFDKSLQAERSPVVRDVLTKDADSHPYLCGCGRRFKLAAHLSNHQKKRRRRGDADWGRSCDQEAPEPQPNRVVEPEPEPEELPTETFKLGVDPSLIEVDEPQPEIKVVMQTPERRAKPDVPDFTLDVPEL
jgi:hypothetical protein